METIDKYNLFFNEFRGYADSVAEESFSSTQKQFDEVIFGFRDTQIKAREAERMVADRFNPFFVMGVAHRETMLHSKIIGELLNPNGTHGQGQVFLKLFSKHFGLNDFFEDTNLNGWRVSLERYAGKGGYIDIYLYHPASEKIVLIENKIFAGDQRDQLIRYYNYAKSTVRFNSHIRLVYLTNDGKDPHPESLSKESTEKLMDLAKQKIYLKRSHVKHTRGWINECLDQIVADRLKIPLEHYLETLP